MHDLAPDDRRPDAPGSRTSRASSSGRSSTIRSAAAPRSTRRAGPPAPEPGGSCHRLADRVEARVHGPCVGAGIELPAFAGRVVAAPDTTFRLPEISMGLIPGAGGTVSIPRRIGRWRTLHLALGGGPLGAADALEWGLVDAVGA